MSSTTVVITACLIFLAIFVVIARLAIRWTLRVMIVAVVLMAVLGVAGFWWWTNRLEPKPRPTRNPATRRAS